MLISELRIYLKTNLSAPTVDFKWSDEDNEKFFTYMCEKYECEKYDNNSLQTNEIQLKIKQAFKEYFEPVGYILFKLKDKQIRIKVLPYKVEPKESVNLRPILEILYNHRDLIEYNYKGSENQISVPEELRAKIYNFVSKIDNEEINKKELVRFAVNQFFKLKSSDIVIIKSDQIFIKLFDTKNRRIVPESEQNTAANRFNGINEEELKTFHRDFFSKQEHKDFFLLTAKTFVKIYMLNKKIDNHTYEKNVFAYVQAIVLEQLTNTFDHNDDFFKGFSGYIFRIHFKEVFGHIANFILTEIAATNDYMIEFLKYYSLNIIVFDAKRYRVPQIETEGGLKWNVISMLSIVKIYVKVRTSIEDAKKKINDIHAKLQALHINGMPPQEYQNMLIKEKEVIVEEIVDYEKKLERFLDSSYLVKTEEEKTALQSEIRQIKDMIHVKKEERIKITEKGVQLNIIASFNHLTAEMDTYVRQVHREKKVLDQNEKSYQSIKYSLAKALTSKKVLVDEQK